MKIIESESWHVTLNWQRYHYAMPYSALIGMFVGEMALCNQCSYILIRFLRLIGGNAVLRDKMSFFKSKYRVLH